MTASNGRMPTLYIPHGGGPSFFMKPGETLGPEGTWDAQAAYLRGLAASLGTKPKAVLVVSAHWEERKPTVNTQATPGMLFDYYGFPDYTYQLKYPAPGQPELAKRVRDLLGKAGIESNEETARGFDHGVFIPFMLVYPEADMPIVELSLVANLDAATHLAIGRALAPLRDEGVLIVGSGMSYHNLRAMMSGDPRGDAAAARFDAWLTETLEDADTKARDARLMDWQKAPEGLASHPRPEHLLPLHVVAGAAGADRGKRTYADKVLGKAQSGFRFG
jgi:aromatic ring-opening dioxygenase catalytic subunit (LigB family)